MIGLFGLLLISSSFALDTRVSNASIQAKELLNTAQKDISEMVLRNISIKRVNESYQEGLQLYSAQMALENNGGSADYSLVTKDATDVSTVEKTALEANDELKIFKETYVNAEKTS